MRGTAEERFWTKVDKSGNCWVWTAGKTQQGYGHLNIERRTILASRYSYELAYGSIPEGLQVLHRCDNPPCVNPDHLFLGTQQDNIDDMIAKGRQGWVAVPADPDEWQRQVLANIAAEKAKYATGPKVGDRVIWRGGVYNILEIAIRSKVSWYRVKPAQNEGLSRWVPAHSTRIRTQ